MTSPRMIGVIGAGTMGTGIAQVCALAGLSVSLIDVDEVRVARGCDALASGFERLCKKAQLSAADRSLHTDELMAAVVASRLRAGRRMSHCFLMQTPAYPRPFIITDAAINSE